MYDILLILDHESQPNRTGLHKILTAKLEKSDAEKYKEERALIGRDHTVSSQRLSGILDLLYKFDLISYYKNTNLLVITELGRDIKKALKKEINLSEILKVGIKEILKKTSSKQG